MVSIVNTSLTEEGSCERNWKVVAVQKKLDASEQEIAELTEKLERLKLAHCRLKEELNATASPILSLPAEILVEIFLLFCDLQKKEPSKLVLQHPPAFVIGSVCRAWRRLVWSTPRMWGTLAITFCPLRIKIQNELLQEWIERSQNTMLSVYLFSEYPEEHEGVIEDEDDDGMHGYYEPPAETFAILCSASDRWRVLHTPAFLRLRERLASGGVRAPVLRDLDFSVCATDHHNGVRSVKWDLSGSSMVREVNLRLWSHEGLGVQWQGVTHVELSMKLSSMLHILLGSKNMESCIIKQPPYRNIGNAFDINLTKTYTCLPNLTSLSFATEPYVVSALLAYISAPNLKYFSLELANAQTSWMTETLEFLKRSSCALTDFVVSNFEDCDFTRLLPYLKTVNRFSLCGGDAILNHLSGHLLEALTPSNNPNFLPNLEELVLEGTLKASIDKISNMIKSRLAPPPPEDDMTPIRQIQHVHIKYDNVSWSRTINPNRLQKFYLELAILSSTTGASLNVQWSERQTF
ncbi:hypothetical protein CPC08DRAFT_715182 [Agrocybe pediades]|nr:hypothetical protein CPC08DRAFT_715182 [Agrocybe pediades]